MKHTKPKDKEYRIGPTRFVGPDPPNTDYLRGLITARNTTLACLKAEKTPRKRIKAVKAELAAYKKELQRLEKEAGSP